MDKRKSILNVTVSVGFKIVTMIMVIIVKRFLINTCGNDVNGLNALYLNLIGFLSVAELGVGSAITFCMYKPIVDGDNDKVSALYCLFHRSYRIIGCIILALGLLVTPFIKYFAKDYSELNVNLYLTFFLMLISVVLTYVFGSKTALINAYKNNYITTAITSGGLFLQYILQVIVLILTKSFILYLVCRIVSALVQWVFTEIITRKMYTPIITNKQKIDSSTKIEIIKNIKAMFMHSIGYLFVNAIDSLVISAFIGVVALGHFSNYTMISESMLTILKLIFTSLTSVVGHFYVESKKESTKRYCEAFHMLNFVLGVIFYLGYYAVINNLISMLFSEDLVVVKAIPFVITINGFVRFMRQSVLVFRDATGTFYNDRWKPLFEGVINTAFSIILVNSMGVTGVIVATVFTNLVICHIIEPYVLYKHAFSMSVKKYYAKNYSMIILFSVALVILDYCMINSASQWHELFVNGAISVGISAVACGIVAIFNRGMIKTIMYRLLKRNSK